MKTDKSLWEYIKRGYVAYQKALTGTIATRIEARKFKCPRCDSRNIKKVKPGLWRRFSDLNFEVLTLGIRKPSKTLNVCRDCGFSWENR